MTMAPDMTAAAPWRRHLERSADHALIGIAVVLPWSPSATSVLLVAWLVLQTPTLSWPVARRVLAAPAAALPIALFLFAAIGMLWADVSWIERWHGFDSFFRLLVIPLMMMHGLRSARVMPVVHALLASCAALLAASFLHVALYGQPWLPGAYPGVPVNDYIVQSTLFVVCAFILLECGLARWREGDRGVAAALWCLAAAFVGNILIVATGRTNLVTLVVLVVVFGLRRSHWRVALAVVAVALAAGVATYAMSSHLRAKVATVQDEVSRYLSGGELTSAGYRLGFWGISLDAMRAAPVLGHGTGGIERAFRETVERRGLPAELVTRNPHNQVLTVGIQLGLAGVALLVATWLSHLLLLWRASGPVAWAGLVVTVTGIVGAMFNSMLFDFTPGWLYILMVGTMAGHVLRESRAD
ncbi:MAG TPA: O-antigen ligase family protein [Xanthobacteraceae bacterium]|nr:O-antigen ligase family protein [Xanthobacteraceae bacterium]